MSTEAQPDPRAPQGPPPALSPARQPGLARALYAALVALGLGSLAAGLYQSRDLTPSPALEADWRAALAAAAERAGPEDLIVVYPPHRHRLLGLLPASVAASGAVPNEPPGQRRYLTLWAASDGAWPPELAAVPLVAEQRFGAVTLRRHQYPDQERILYDFAGRWREARVWLERGAERIACDQLGPEGWQCRGQPVWNRVGPITQEVEGLRYACLWAHPVSGATLHIAYDDVPLGDELRAELALSDGAAGMGGGAPVNVELRVWGRAAEGTSLQPSQKEPAPGRDLGPAPAPLARLPDWQRSVSHPNRRGPTALTIPTAPADRARVEWIISTPSDGRRHFCFNASARQARRPGQTTP